MIEKDCDGKYSDNIILIENPSFSDEPQEFDHLVIPPQGIFNIETKIIPENLRLIRQAIGFV